jgi:hypothetical protein
MHPVTSHPTRERQHLANAPLLEWATSGSRGRPVWDRLLPECVEAWSGLGEALEGLGCGVYLVVVGGVGEAGEFE